MRLWLRHIDWIGVALVVALVLVVRAKSTNEPDRAILLLILGMLLVLEVIPTTIEATLVWWKRRR